MSPMIYSTVTASGDGHVGGFDGDGNGNLGIITGCLIVVLRAGIVVFSIFSPKH